jgi:hypothetical protein
VNPVPVAAGSAIHIFRLPSRLNTHANRFLVRAAIRSLGKGALSTCDNVNELFWLAAPNPAHVIAVAQSNNRKQPRAIFIFSCSRK